MMWDEEITLLTPDGYDEDSLGQQILKLKKISFLVMKNQ